MSRYVISDYFCRPWRTSIQFQVCHVTAGKTFVHFYTAARFK